MVIFKTIGLDPPVRETDREARFARQEQTTGYNDRLLA